MYLNPSAWHVVGTHQAFTEWMNNNFCKSEVFHIEKQEELLNDWFYYICYAAHFNSELSWVILWGASFFSPRPIVSLHICYREKKLKFTNVCKLLLVQHCDNRCNEKLTAKLVGMRKLGQEQWQLWEGGVEEGCDSPERPRKVPVRGGAGPERWAEGTQGEQ